MVRQYINAHSSRAFTLIEVSIVIVAIGLLIGAALVGQALIRAAELRAVMTEIDTFKTATTILLRNTIVSLVIVKQLLLSSVRKPLVEAAHGPLQQIEEQTKPLVMVMGME